MQLVQVELVVQLAVLLWSVTFKMCAVVDNANLHPVVMINARAYVSTRPIATILLVPPQLARQILTAATLAA